MLKIINKFYPLYEALLYISIICIIFCSIISNYIIENGLVYSAPIITRFGLFIGICTYAGFVFLDKLYAVPKLSNSNNTLKILNLLVFPFVFGAIIQFYFINNIGLGYAKSAIAITFISYLYIFFDSSWLNFRRFNYAFFIVLLLTLLTLLWPIIKPGVLNSESNYDNYFFAELNKKFDNINSQNDFQVKLSDGSINLVKDNIELNLESNVLTNKSQIVFYRLEGNNLYLSPANPNGLCLLLSRPIQNNFQFDLDFNKLIKDKFTSCVKQISNHTANSNFYNKINNLTFEKDINDNYEYLKDFSILADKNITNFFSLPPSERKEISEQIQIIDNRGLYLHHFNSIVQTVNESHGRVINFFNNQYGFGPLFVTSLFLPLSSNGFDAVYFSTVFVNFFFLLIVLLTIRGFRKIDKFIVTFGFLLSIFTTYAGQQMMAPSVYYLRYFPSILLFLYLYRKIYFDNTLQDINYIYLIILSSLIGIYNFEYAILTAGALFFYSLFARRIAYFFYSVLISFLAIGFKSYASISYGQSISDNTRYLSYLTPVAPGPFDEQIFIFFIISLIVVIPFFWYVITNKKDVQQHALLLLLFVAFMAKLVWIGAWNHCGPLFLLIACLVTLKIKNKISLSYNGFNYSYFIFPAATLYFLYVLIHSLPGYFLNKKFELNKYLFDPEISRLMPITKSMSNKMTDFKEIYKSNDLVLSKIDNGLALKVNQKITLPYPDVSTNINYVMDIEKIKDSYLNSNRNIIIDNDLLTNNYVDVSAKIWKLPGSSNLFKFHFAEEKKLKFITRDIQLSYSICQKSIYFTKFCK